MIIQVKQKHIDQGVRDSHDNSPLALALKDAFPDKVVIVSNKRFRVGDKLYDIPKHVRTAEWLYEQYMKIEPYQFTFEP